MDLLKISEKPLTFEQSDTISKLTSEMLRKRKHEALIFDGKKFKGIITAEDLVMKNVNEQRSIKIKSLKSLIKPTKSFSSKSDITEVIDAFLINNYYSVPVFRNKKFYTINRLDLLKAIPSNVLKNRKASDAMIFPQCIGADDTLDVAKSVLKQTKSTEMVVINKKSKVQGIVDSLDLLETFIDKKRTSKGELDGRKIKSGKILVNFRKIMKQDFIKVKPETALKDIVKKMVTENKDKVIVERDKLLGMITPVNIMTLSRRQYPGVRVYISGQQKEDTFIKAVIDEEIRNEIKKLGKFLVIDYLIIHIDRYHEEGKKIKYSVKARLISEWGYFFADDHSWDITKTIRGVLEKLEREVTKKKEKSKVYRRGA